MKKFMLVVGVFCLAVLQGSAHDSLNEAVPATSEAVSQDGEGSARSKSNFDRSDIVNREGYNAFLDMLGWYSDMHYVQVGIGDSKFSGSNYDRLSFKVSYGFSSHLSEKLQLEDRFSLSLKGYGYKEDLGELGYASLVHEEKTSSYWFEADMLARYGNAFSVAGGIYLASCFGGKIKHISGAVGNTSETKYDYLKNNRWWDVGLVLDARYVLGRWMMGVEMMQGFFPVQKGSSFRNFGVWLYAGYAF